MRVRGPRRRDDAVTTATTTGRSSFACDGLAFAAKASSDMSPAGGGVAGNLRCMPAGATCSLRATEVGIKPPAVRGGCSRRSARESPTSWSTSMDSGASPEAWRRYTATGRNIRDPGRHGQPRARDGTGQGTVFPDRLGPRSCRAARLLTCQATLPCHRITTPVVTGCDSVCQSLVVWKSRAGPRAWRMVRPSIPGPSKYSSGWSCHMLVGASSPPSCSLNLWGAHPPVACSG